MSQQSAIDHFSRFNRIINFFKTQTDCETTLDDVYKHLNEPITKKTLGNYFKQITDIGYDIVYLEHTKSTYKLTRNNLEDKTEAYDNLLIAHSITKENIDKKILFTGTKEYRGTEHFFPLKDAIEKKCLVTFMHLNFETGESKEYMVQPYALKENRGRWYLLGFKCDESIPKSFGLDRMSDLLVLTNEKFTPRVFDWEAHYKDCFAMYSPAKPAERVIISMNTHDANYVRSKPMHHSQKELSATAERVRFELYVKITEDFLMELMSRSWSIHVEEPASLRDTLTKHWQEAIERHR